MGKRYWGCALAGLQSFVYDVPQEDAAKRLRARSATLIFVPALVAHRVRLVDPQADLLYLGGGKVLVGVSQDLTELEGELRSWSRELAQLSGGSLGLYWAEGDTPAALLAALAEAKWRSGRQADGSWFGHLGAPALVPSHRRLGHPDWEADFGREVGKRLGAAGIRTGGEWRIVGEERVELVDDAGAAEIDFGEGREGGGISVSLPRYVPMKNADEVLSFNEIAEQAQESGKGIAYLAVLKLDGDQIGKTLRARLDEGLDAYKDASARLSRFFGTTVPQILESQFPHIYLVYSGGDDLVAVGHYRDILDTALLIHREYGEGTVSSGISFFGRKSPVLHAVEKADGYLERSKDRGRNRVTVGGQTMTWPHLERALALSDQIAAACEAGHLPSSMVQLLRQLGGWFLDTSAVAASVAPCKAAVFLSYFYGRRNVRSDELTAEVQAYFNELQESEEPWRLAGLVGTLASWKMREVKV
ncbi:MAG: hypothetical protein KatS3mg015_0306 [Fimbriimonadales bacterium]|nr:MAG: hypothetical protein KatS3mg015_0306 [Fimbriimonadales bacterium]